MDLLGEALIQKEAEHQAQQLAIAKKRSKANKRGRKGKKTGL